MIDLTAWSTRHLVHLTSQKQSEQIQHAGFLQPRESLPRVPNSYARADLVVARANIEIDPGLPLNACVPFYLHPVQPMFLRLLLSSVIELDDLVLYWFPLDSLDSNGYEHAVFDTNPAYPEAVRTSLVSLAPGREHTGLARPWYDAQADRDLRRRLMLERQAEALVVPPCGGIPVHDLVRAPISTAELDPLGFNRMVRAGYAEALARRPTV